MQSRCNRGGAALSLGKEKILRCPREHRGDCELVPLEKEAPLVDDNCQRGCGTTSAGAEICVLH